MPKPRLLFVCLGNICRSPAAEGVARRALAEAGIAATLDSAGVGDWHLGAPPDRRMQAAARARGLDLGDLRARQAIPADFARFDLILAMDRANLRDLQGLRPQDGQGADLALMLDFHPDPALAEIPDPYFGGAGGFDEVLDMLEAAMPALIERVARR